MAARNQDGQYLKQFPHKKSLPKTNLNLNLFKNRDGAVKHDLHILPY